MKEKSVELLSVLREKTQSKEIKWEKTSNPNEYKVQFSNGSAVTISKQPNAHQVGFVIFNDKGGRVDSATILSSSSVAPPPTSAYTIINDIIISITKIENKEDETFDYIFNELKKKNVQ
jgi:hypothetical protein